MEINIGIAEQDRAAIAAGLSAAAFMEGTERAIDRELDRWRPAAAA